VDVSPPLSLRTWTFFEFRVSTLAFPEVGLGEAGYEIRAPRRNCFVIRSRLGSWETSRDEPPDPPLPRRKICDRLTVLERRRRLSHQTVSSTAQILMSSSVFPAFVPAERPAAVESDWRESYDRLAPRLLLFARQWVGGMTDAEDVVQEAFVRCWRHGGGRNAENSALLFAAVRSAALDARRREERRRRRENDAAPVVDIVPFNCALEDRELAESVQAALHQLPLEQREVLVLRIWAELSFPEIAEVLDIGVDTAASRHRYALGALRKIIPVNPLQ
jgi:RNA polymerase sigma-70 factor (ECF subfamily)